jgi:hypothetical protein
MSDFDGLSRINERAIVGVLKTVLPSVTIEHVTDFDHPNLREAGLDFTQSLPLKGDQLLRYVVSDHTKPSAPPIAKLLECQGTWGWMFDTALGTRSADSLFACIVEKDLGRRVGRIHEALAGSGGKGFLVANTFSRGHILVIQAALLKTIIGKTKA